MLSHTTNFPGTQNLAKAARFAPPSASRALADSFDMIGAPMTYARNTEIYGDDEPADYIYKLVSGTVRTSKILNDGRRQIGGFYLPGDLFGHEVRR